MKNELRSIELTEGLYWVGEDEGVDGLHCNSYLIIDDREDALIDPGSVLDFEKVFSNVTKLIPLENIKYVIFNYGSEIGNEVIKNLSYILINKKEENH
ncbi:hypothetical protein CPJCM30710_17770 [Clostridium polyendosporum]|uniref:ODP domain-containing protein n=1 Tax=Clostridium polyendosporum TaxID=69208 RepID=A0A919S0L6_9CLOT|nr:hypothetical protein [Clostridium polyendosporum]GIM29111.1 hypothetical protein CPJCM30710_17770 [Clostridium polyendosporum]